MKYSGRVLNSPLFYISFTKSCTKGRLQGHRDGRSHCILLADKERKQKSKSKKQKENYNELAS